MTALSQPNEFAAFASLLLTASRACSLYPEGHPRREESLHQLHVRVSSHLLDSEELRFAVIGDEFVVGQRQVPSTGTLLPKLAELLVAAGVTRCHIRRGVTAAELRAFVAALALEPALRAAQGGIEAVVARAGMAHISAGPVAGGVGAATRSAPIADAYRAYGAALIAVSALATHGEADAALARLDAARGAINELVRVGRLDPLRLLALHSTHAASDEPCAHAVNVLVLTLAMGCHLGLDEPALRELGLAALLHDVGKTRVDPALLGRPGPLDAAELADVRRHGVEATRLFAARADVPRLVTVVAFEHQLAYAQDDRQRWPPHLASQLVAIADVYDALRSPRPYRAALPPDRALDEMWKDADAKLDRALLEGFSRMVGHYPPGTCVKLAGGHVGFVLRANPDHPSSPHVVIALDAMARPVEPPATLDLSAVGDERFHVASVVSSADAGLDPLDYL